MNTPRQIHCWQHTNATHRDATDYLIFRRYVPDPYRIWDPLSPYLLTSRSIRNRTLASLGLDDLDLLAVMADQDLPTNTPAWERAATDWRSVEPEREAPWE